MSSSSLYDSYARADLEFVRGEGSRLYTSDGAEYLDFIAGIAVMSLGHSHPALIEAVKKQAEQLWHVSNLFEIPGQRELGRLLCEHTFADRVFFTNSGTEAMECAFKTARRYHYANGSPDRTDIITFEGAFHGRSLAGIAATGNEKYLEGFGPKAGGFVQVPFGDLSILSDTISPTTAAIIVEPIQGEGGIRPFTHEDLRHIRKLCDDNGILLIYDEIQCGVGRTAKLFAHEWAETDSASASPDIMAIAKGIGGGFPLGACLAREEVAASMNPGSHGSTYGGNPLAMAIGTAVLTEILRDNFLDEVHSKGLMLKQGLAGLVDSHPDFLESFRGEGLMQGIKCKVPNTDIVSAFRSHNLLVAPAGDNVVRLVPPLTTSESDIRLAVERMDAALTSLSESSSSESSSNKSSKD